MVDSIAFKPSSGLGGRFASGRSDVVNPNTVQQAPPGGDQSRTTQTLAQTKIEGNRESDNSPIIFPEDLGSDYYISFNAFVHSTERPKDSIREFTFQKSIFLPLPTNLTDSYSAGYSSEDLFYAGNVLKELGQSAFEGGIVEGVKKMLDANAIAGAAARGMQYLADQGKEGAARALTNLGMQALRGTGGAVPSAIKSSLQLTANPFPPVTFDWILYPESQSETNIIKKIIGFFRREMLPESMPGNKAILKTPSVFEIQLLPEESMRKFKRCVLTNMGVNYAPHGPSFVRENQFFDRNPVAVSLSLTFQEIELWLADDYEPSETNFFSPK